MNRIGFWLAFVLALTAQPLTARASPSAFESAPPDPRAITIKGQGDGRAVRIRKRMGKRER